MRIYYYIKINMTISMALHPVIVSHNHNIIKVMTFTCTLDLIHSSNASEARNQLKIMAGAQFWTFEGQFK